MVLKANEGALVKLCISKALQENKVIADKLIKSLEKAGTYTDLEKLKTDLTMLIIIIKSIK